MGKFVIRQTNTGIKFDLTEEGLNLTGSDTDLSISTFIPVETNTNQNITVFSTGSCVLNAKYITEIVKKIDSDRIELELIDSTLVKITDQKSNFRNCSRCSFCAARYFPAHCFRQGGRQYRQYYYTTRPHSYRRHL